MVPISKRLRIYPITVIEKNLFLNGVFAKSERGYRLQAKQNCNKTNNKYYEILTVHECVEKCAVSLYPFHFSRTLPLIAL